MRLHAIPLSIISDQAPQFTSRFWRSLQKGLGTKVKLSTTFHPQTDGQEERTVQTLEDMLRACIFYFKGNWDKHLPLVEFAYNNSFHASIFPWLSMKPCMVGGVGLLSDDLKWLSLRFLVPIWFIKFWRNFISLGTG